MQRMAVGIGAMTLVVAVIFGTATAGTNSWTTVGPEGGAISALTVGIQGTVYASTHFAGIFKSRNSGDNWIGLPGGMNSPGVANALLVDPNDPQKLLVGTQPMGGAPGTLFISRDGGNNWAKYALPDPDGQQPVLSLALDATGTLYLGTNNGIYKGQYANGDVISLTKVLGLDAEVRAILISGTTIYAGARSFSSQDGGLWISVDGGPWIKQDLSTGMGISCLAEGNGTVYAGGTNGVVKKGSGDPNWTQFNDGLRSVWISALAVGSGSDVYLGIYQEGVYKSSNGSSWRITGAIPNTRIQCLAYDPLTGAILAGTFYAGGVYKSTNGGLSWADANRGLTGAQPTSIVIENRTTPPTIFAGTHAGAFKTVEGSNTWTAINTGLMGGNVEAMAVDPSRAGTVYASDAQWGGGVFKSDDYGNSWRQIFILQGGEKKVDAIAVAPSGLIFAGTTNLGGPQNNGGVFQGTDGGTWTLVYTGDIWALALDPGDPNTLYAGTNGSGVLRGVLAPDGSITWANISDGLPPSSRIGSISIGSTAIYAVIGGMGTFVREKGDGKEWTPMPSPISWMNFSAVYAAPNTRTVYAAGLKAYRSLDGGASWQLLNNQDLWGISRLAVDSRDPATIYAGANSIYEMTYIPPETNKPPVAVVGPDITAEATSPLGAMVKLDGKKSYDPDGDKISFQWSTDPLGIVFDDPKSPSPTAVFPLGKTNVKLVVTDTKSATGKATLWVKVVDTTPPVITLPMAITDLWPPDHKMVLVAKGVGAKDIADPSPVLDIAVESNEPDNGLGDGDMAPDFEVKRNADGTADVYLRAERSGKGNGRIYTIRVTASDASENSATSQATATVAKSQGKKLALLLEDDTPSSFGMGQNAPNPFNPATTIRYALPVAGDVQLAVYNLMGQQVKVLVSGFQGPGYYNAVWDGRDAAGQPVASGLYLYRLSANQDIAVGKMILAR